MILDDLMPEWDATLVVHRVVNCEPERAYDAAMKADFLDALRANRLAAALIAIRTSLERIAARIRGLPRTRYDEPESLRLADMPERGEWVSLGSDPPREVAFGVIGRFWGGETSWEQIDAAEFASYTEPGRARIASNFSFRPYGEERTLITYETRTQATDLASRRGFLRYWRVASPLIGIVLRSMLRVIARNAERPAPGTTGAGSAERF
jgi:hypothetical protein